VTYSKKGEFVMRYHETISKEYLNELCESYLTQSAWANAAQDEKEKELRRVADARPYAVAIGRAEFEWRKPEIEAELSIRFTMVSLMKFAPGSVQYTEGF
jgi:hypothetical protein